jgi:tripartite-type tricarboxylate transporter receptor subunit TctC
MLAPYRQRLPDLFIILNARHPTLFLHIHRKSPMNQHFNQVSRRDTLKMLMAASAAIALPSYAAWPEKPIKIVVTFPPGGASDIVARVMAEELGKKLGQAVVVDNRPGAGGSVGGLLAAQSSADGHTLMLSNSTPVSIGPFALEKQPYDPVEAFTHIASVGVAPCVVMANPSAGLRLLQDVESFARKSGRLDFGSGGPASIGHIYGELMKKELGVNLVHIPYRGGAPMTTDLISGVIPVGIDVLTAYLPFFKSGQLVPLAVSSAKRSPLLPDVPCVTEVSSYRKLVLENFFGISGPAKMPRDVVTRINNACNEILAQPDIKKRLLDLGITTTPGSPEAFTAYVKEQVSSLAPVVRGAGVKL